MAVPALRVDASGVTLDAYFAQTFLPTLRGKSRNFVNGHTRAVELLESYLGRSPQVDQIDDDLLAEFREHLVEMGRTATYADKLACAIKSIRYMHANGERRQRRGPSPFVDPPAATNTLRHFFEETYSRQRLIGCHRAGVARYVTAFRFQREHYGRDLRLNELNDQIAADHFEWLIEQGMIPATLNSGHRATWFAVWRFAFEKGLVAQPPTVRALRVGVETPDAWSLEQVGALVANTHAASQQSTIAKIPTAEYWRALLLVGWWTGLRRRSLFEIERKDVDLETGWLSVPSTKMKNARGQVFRLGDDAIAACREIWAPARKFLFPWPHDPRGIATQFNRIIDAAGVPRSRRRQGQFHKLRRSVATVAAARSGIGAAAALLGHSKEAVTARYIDPSKMPGTDATKFLPAIPTAPK